MAWTQAAPPGELRRTVDAIRESVSRLETYLPETSDNEVLTDFLEDDLREGLAAVADVEAYFTDILELLATEKPSAIRLLEASDDWRTLARLEYLHVVVAQLRRRLTQAAGSVRPVSSRQ